MKQNAKVMEKFEKTMIVASKIEGKRNMMFNISDCVVFVQRGFLLGTITEILALL